MQSLRRLFCQMLAKLIQWNIHLSLNLFYFIPIRFSMSYQIKFHSTTSSS